MFNEEFKSHIDFDGALSRVRGNKKLYRKMLTMFLDSKELQEFEDNLSQKDFVAAGDSAHAIKGITGNLSFTRLYEKSTELMVQLRKGEYQEATYLEYKDALQKTKQYVMELSAQMDAELGAK